MGAISAPPPIAAWPVGSVFISIIATNPSVLLGGGTWVAFGAGRVMVGLDAGQPEFDVVEETGGAKTHTLTTAEMPAHTHGYDKFSSSSSDGVATNTVGGYPVVSGNSNSTGGGGAHNNLQPYIVCRFWKRTA